ncbi:MAG: TIGR02147 family protein [Pseudobdellovibrionaceae bacterium]
MDRPIITHYQTPADYVKDMIQFRKTTEKDFSIAQFSKKLRRVSPALVSLVIGKKRNLTLDRVDEFSKLMNLNASEKNIFRHWVGQLEDKEFVSDTPMPAFSEDSRKSAGLGLLNDWINVYVKDLLQIAAIQKDPTLIEKQLRTIASPPRIKKALEYLLHEGYLRRTLDGSIVLETKLAITEPPIPSKKIRTFHKGAMQIAKVAMDLYPPEERLANTMTIPLDENSYRDLLEITAEYTEKLKDFAAKNQSSGNRLYQLIVNISPVGGKLE